MSAERIVLGVQPVREALKVWRDGVARVLIEAGAGAPDKRLEGVSKLASDLGVSVVSASRGELDRMTKGARHQGILAFAPELKVADDKGLIDAVTREIEQSPETPRLVVLCDGLMDPQNFGATIRSAVALGGDAWVVWPEHSSAPLTPATFRASAGAIEHARLAKVRSLTSVMAALHDLAFSTVLLDAHASAPLHSVDLKGSVALVVGAEDRAPRPALRKAAAHVVTLPMSAKIDSLNASVAAAIALYEIARQRHLS